MDIPIYHLDFLNNRMLVAVVAILHVVINHALAVGGLPLLAFLEWRGARAGREDVDTLVFRVFRAFFVVTTTVGAMSGVAIWFSTSLVNPYAIGSLLRVFFWTWFVEWLVFVSEVVLILAYYLTWKRPATAAQKRRHLRWGLAVSIASWLTMSLIVMILGFMMDPGSWQTDRSLWSGMFNPLYLPQLAFRTPLAMAMAGTAVLLAAHLFGGDLPDARRFVTRRAALWTLAWLPGALLGGLWYASSVPEAMRVNVPVGLLTQALATWSEHASLVAACVVGFVALAALWAAVRAHLPRGMGFAAFVAMAALLGTFERVREFVRKPYAIGGYLYANGIRKDDYDILQRDGLLAHATYVHQRVITGDNELAAGKDVFALACSRCHTVNGVNSVREALANMFGDAHRWDAAKIDGYLGTMHMARPFMPPFPGNAEERMALATYLVSLQLAHEGLEGAQIDGAPVAPPTQSPTSPLALGGVP